MTCVTSTAYFAPVMNSFTLTAPMTSKARHVQTTTDYFMFQSIDGNRAKNQLHLKRLEKSIADNYLFTIITVNENYEIIDGQHRFEVIKKLKLPLNYVVCEGYGLREVQLLNANSKNWQSDDYLSGYCDLGYEDYLKYRTFKKKYKLGHAECMTLLARGANGDNVKKFAMGEFKIKDLAKSEKTIEQILLVKPFYEGVRRRSFVYAMIYLLNHPRFNMIEFLSKLRLQPTTLVDCTNTASYVTLIEEIYNYRRRDKVNLRYL